MRIMLKIWKFAQFISRTLCKNQLLFHFCNIRNRPEEGTSGARHACLRRTKRWECNRVVPTKDGYCFLSAPPWNTSAEPLDKFTFLANWKSIWTSTWKSNLESVLLQLEEFARITVILLIHEVSFHLEIQVVARCCKDEKKRRKKFHKISLNRNVYQNICLTCKTHCCSCCMFVACINISFASAFLSFFTRFFTLFIFAFSVCLNTMTCQLSLHLITYCWNRWNTLGTPCGTPCARGSKAWIE